MMRLWSLSGALDEVGPFKEVAEDYGKRFCSELMATSFDDYCAMAATKAPENPKEFGRLRFP